MAIVEAVRVDRLWSGTSRYLTLSLVAVVLVIGMMPRAEAQTFTFTPTGEFANSGGSVLFSALTITANATSNSYLGNAAFAQYNITGISGTYNGNAITGLLAPGTNVGVHSVNNALFSSGTGFLGTTFVGRDETPNNHLSLGFGFTTDAGSFLVCDLDCVLAEDQNASAMHVFEPLGLTTVIGGGFTSAVAVPGPLAGAGVLSYLAVLLMGLAWRGRWFVARLRGWLAAQESHQP